MFFIHEVHSVASQSAARLEDVLRCRWAPALEREPGARLVWCARSMPGSAAFPEVITLTAIDDGPALERFGERVRDGDLRDDVLALDESRVEVTRRVLAPLKFSPYDPTATPASEVPSQIFVHDFVPPRTGMQRQYEDVMQTVFMFMVEAENIPIVIWAAFETVVGGGPVPETVNVSRVEDHAQLARLFSQEMPRDEVKPGSWLFDALMLRDSWTSRLVRATSWSPTR